MANDNSSGHCFNEHVNQILFVMFLLVLVVLLIKGCESSFSQIKGGINHRHEQKNDVPRDSSRLDSLLVVQ